MRFKTDANLKAFQDDKAGKGVDARLLNVSPAPPPDAAVLYAVAALVAGSPPGLAAAAGVLPQHPMLLFLSSI